MALITIIVCFEVGSAKALGSITWEPWRSNPISPTIKKSTVIVIPWNHSLSNPVMVYYYSMVI